MTLRPIDPSPLRARYAGAKSEPGERPELQWLKIARLRIDPRYQREIGRRGADNILKIAPAFSWAKFTPVVVAPIEGGSLFAIVDGQHRTTAAALRGFESVPCVIIAASEAEQADAFVAINANVTAMSPLQLHAARLAAGDGAATQLTEVCKTAAVTICRYPVPANKMQPGETLAVAMLQEELDRHGRDQLVAALSCITQTCKGNVGMIRKPVVQALCAALTGEWTADLKRLIFAMQSFDFAGSFNAARAKSVESGAKVSAILAGVIAAHLETAPGSGAGTVQTPVAPQPSAAVPAASGKSAAAAHAVVDHKGIKVNLTPEQEGVTFNGRSIRVSARGARLVAALAKAKPNCIGDDFLIGKIWKARPSNASAMIDMVVRDLAVLKQIGLEVRTQRGIGRQLAEATA